MTHLVVEELRGTLSQEFTINLKRRYQIKVLRPYIYMHNTPAGTFTFTVKSGGVALASKSFTSASIKSDLGTTDDYAHLYKTLEFDTVIPLEKGTYSIVLSSSGYTFSDSSYLGWIKPHENIFNENTGEVNSLNDYSFGFELFELRKMESFK